jgi:hypothetical protein
VISNGNLAARPILPSSPTLKSLDNSDQCIQKAAVIEIIPIITVFDGCLVAAGARGWNTE